MTDQPAAQPAAQAAPAAVSSSNPSISDRLVGSQAAPLGQGPDGQLTNKPANLPADEKDKRIAELEARLAAAEAKNSAGDLAAGQGPGDRLTAEPEPPFVPLTSLSLEERVGYLEHVVFELSANHVSQAHHHSFQDLTEWFNWHRRTHEPTEEEAAKDSQSATVSPGNPSPPAY